MRVGPLEGELPDSAPGLVEQLKSLAQVRVGPLEGELPDSAPGLVLRLTQLGSRLYLAGVDSVYICIY